MKGWRGVVAAAVVAGSLASAQPARAAFLEDAGWGTLTMLTNVVYMPVKLVYAACGGLTGGLAYGLTAGDLQTAETVWVTSMGGTYVVTPGMLRGEEPISFAGSPTPATGSSVSDAHPADEQQLGARPLEEQQLGGS